MSSSDNTIPMVSIPLGEYEDLLDSQNKLIALEAGGVDNWTWYGESLKEYWKEKDKND